MNLRRQIKTLAPYLLILVTIVSLTYIAFEEQNYARYFSAVGDLTSTTNRVSVRSIPPGNTTTVRTDVSATNPTDYSGFQVYAFTVTIFFQNRQDSNITLFQADPIIASITATRPLGPKSTVNTELVFTLLPRQASEFSTFNQTYPGQVDAHVVLQTQVNSFLNPVTGRIVTVAEQKIPLS